MSKSNTLSRVELARAALVALATGDAQAVGDLFAADVVGWTPVLQVVNRDQLIIELADQRASFSDVEVTADPVELPGGRVAAEWVVTGRQTGPVVFGDEELPPTGIAVSLRGAMFAEISDGRVVNFRQYWSEVDILEQLGLHG